jgi:hypothetical protein
MDFKMNIQACSEDQEKNGSANMYLVLDVLVDHPSTL